MDGVSHQGCQDRILKLETELAEEKRLRLAAEARAAAAEAENRVHRGIEARRMLEDYPGLAA